MQTSRETSLVFTHTHIRIGNTLWKTLVLLPLMRRSLFCVCIYGENTQAKIFGCVCENDESTSSQQQSEEQDVCLRIIDFCQSSSASVCLSVEECAVKLPTSCSYFSCCQHLFMYTSCVHVIRSVRAYVCMCVSVCVCVSSDFYSFLCWPKSHSLSLSHISTTAFVSVLYPGGGGVCRFSSFFSCSIESVSIRECVLIVLELHV